ncbi:11168_t:CDS:2 [Entrophospora sp. SA101]|nr:11168_t:CDS:2 [Entrophospora sp. SA101]
MINSLIDCHKRKIIINRVLINNNNNQELLVNPVQIKEATIHHFQTCAGGINMRKEIPQQWQQQYSPKSNINPDIYNTLMDLPSLNECAYKKEIRSTSGIAAYQTFTKQIMHETINKMIPDKCDDFNSNPGSNKFKS